MTLADLQVQSKGFNRRRVVILRDLRFAAFMTSYLHRVKEKNFPSFAEFVEERPPPEVEQAEEQAVLTLQIHKEMQRAIEERAHGRGS